MVCKAVILAAGLGTRMKSDIPKVLHGLGGAPMLSWSVDACREATGAEPYVVVGPEVDQIQEILDEDTPVVIQSKRLGTGHALMQAAETLRGNTDFILVTHADMPLIKVETFRRLIECQLDNDGPLTLLSAVSDDPRGFGRIERDESNQILGIVEEAHANERQLAITELNVGAYCFRADWVWEHLDQLPVSPKGEYYLTDLVGIAAVDGMKVMNIPVESLDESIGVNTRVHIAEAELALRKRILTRWMESGVTMRDPSTTYVESGVSIGQDTLLLPNTHLEGKTVVGSGCTVGPNTIIRSSTIGDACTILSSVVEHATMEDDVEIGPYAHLRTGTYLEQGVHVGNFGEIKNSRLGRGVKMGHFSYIGDATIGEGVNIGAGTITCNFDGERKNKTEIGSGAFIGSDTMLVAPVRIGKGARTGAGSVVTKDVPDNSIAVGIPARVVRKRKDRE